MIIDKYFQLCYTALSMNHAVIRIGFQVTYGSVVTILLAAAQGNFFVRVLFAPFAFQPVRVIRGSAAFESYLQIIHMLIGACINGHSVFGLYFIF